MLFSRDNLKNFDTIMCLFDRFVNHVNCCYYFYVVVFFLLFIMCKLAKKKKKKKKDQKETKTKNAQMVKSL